MENNKNLDEIFNYSKKINISHKWRKKLTKLYEIRDFDAVRFLGNIAFVTRFEPKLYPEKYTLISIDMLADFTKEFLEEYRRLCDNYLNYYTAVHGTNIDRYVLNCISYSYQDYRDLKVSDFP